MVQVSITNCIFVYKRMYKKVFFNYNQKITQNFIKMNNKVCHTYIQYRYGKIRSQNSHSKQQSQSYIYWQFLELFSFWPCVECQCCMPSKIVESKSYIQKLYVLTHYRDMRTGNTWFLTTREQEYSCCGLYPHNDTP